MQRWESEGNGAVEFAVRLVTRSVYRTMGNQSSPGRVREAIHSITECEILLLQECHVFGNADIDSYVRRVRTLCRAAPVLLGVAACGEGPLESTLEDPNPALSVGCAVTTAALFNGGPGRDGIPALINPPLVTLDHPAAGYVDSYAARAAGTFDAAPARVVGFIVGGTPIAIPHNILWWHEIVHLDAGGRRVAVTYCPLTGSAIVFDASEAETRRFGVSGLIFQNNLVMFDEETESLWPQLCRSAEIGPRRGTELVQVPAIEMEWEAWKARHPNSLIVSAETGFNRDYSAYPYSEYEGSERLLFQMPNPIDPRRLMKERVFGIPSGDGGIAVPFAEFAQVGETVVISMGLEGEEVLLLWDSHAQAAAAYYARTTEGVAVRLQARAGSFVDFETKSRWNVEGEAVDGALTGSRLVPYADAFVAFWFAWAAFHPRTSVWTAE